MLLRHSQRSRHFIQGVAALIPEEAFVPLKAPDEPGSLKKSFVALLRLSFRQNTIRYILEAFDLRNLGDYGTIHSVNKTQAEELMHHAKEMTDAIQTQLT